MKNIKNFKNPCEECICLPMCIIKTNSWSKQYASRFAMITTFCEIAQEIWTYEIPKDDGGLDYIYLHRYIMNEWWRKYDKTDYEHELHLKMWRIDYEKCGFEYKR